MLQIDKFCLLISQILLNDLFPKQRPESVVEFFVSHSVNRHIVQYNVSVISKFDAKFVLSFICQHISNIRL